MIDWESLLRRYIAIKYLPKAGTEPNTLVGRADEVFV
jgi:hypothetical protein